MESNKRFNPQLMRKVIINGVEIESDRWDSIPYFKSRLSTSWQSTNEIPEINDPMINSFALLDYLSSQSPQNNRSSGIFSSMMEMFDYLQIEQPPTFEMSLNAIVAIQKGGHLDTLINLATCKVKIIFDYMGVGASFRLLLDECMKKRLPFCWTKHLIMQTRSMTGRESILRPILMIAIINNSTPMIELLEAEGVVQDRELTLDLVNYFFKQSMPNRPVSPLFEKDCIDLIRNIAKDYVTDIGVLLLSNYNNYYIFWPMMIELITNHGFDINTPSAKGFLLLDLLYKMEINPIFHSTLRFLIDRGARSAYPNTGPRFLVKLLSHKDNNEKNEDKNVRIGSIRFLLQRDVDPFTWSVSPIGIKFYPIDLIILDPDLIQLLPDYQSAVNRVYDGRLPISSILDRGKLKGAKSLQRFNQILDLGFDLNKEDGYGRNSILILISHPNCSLRAIKILHDRGANLSHRDKEGKGVLDYFIKYRSRDECTYLRFFQQNGISISPSV